MILILALAVIFLAIWNSKLKKQLKGKDDQPELEPAESQKQSAGSQKRSAKSTAAAPDDGAKSKQQDEEEEDSSDSDSDSNKANKVPAGSGKNFSSMETHAGSMQ